VIIPSGYWFGLPPRAINASPPFIQSIVNIGIAWIEFLVWYAAIPIVAPHLWAALIAIYEVVLEGVNMLSLTQLIRGKLVPNSIWYPNTINTAIIATDVLACPCSNLPWVGYSLVSGAPIEDTVTLKE